MEQQEQNDIFLSDSIEGIRTEAKQGCLAHLLCLQGCCDLLFNGKRFELKAGDLVIVRHRSLIEQVSASDDFKCRIVYASRNFIALSTPQNNYAIKGRLSLLGNPVIPLDAEQLSICIRDFDLIEQRLNDREHCFYRESLINAMQAAILDFFEFHARMGRAEDTSARNASIMNRFLSILEEGTFRKHRKVDYYADRLCISSKYLSEVSKQVSGFAANYWINRYTALDISQQLRNKELSIADVSDMFNFSSQAYFSRYVRRTLGARPSELRRLNRSF